MTPEYEFIDIDPTNPPEMPCDAVFSMFDNLVTHTWTKDVKLISIALYCDKVRFIDNYFNVWKYAKLRKEKPIDFRNRWVKIKTRNQIDNRLCVPSFTCSMEEEMPVNRIIYVNEIKVWKGYIISQEMISEILPINYQPERELDDTIKRQWFYSDASGEKYINQWFVTEKHFVQNFCTVNGVVSYAPGLVCPEEKEWRKV